jgi:hypothetical protein
MRNQLTLAWYLLRRTGSLELSQSLSLPLGSCSWPPPSPPVRPPPGVTPRGVPTYYHRSLCPSARPRAPRGSASAEPPRRPLTSAHAAHRASARAASILNESVPSSTVTHTDTQRSTQTRNTRAHHSQRPAGHCNPPQVGSRVGDTVAWRGSPTPFRARVVPTAARVNLPSPHTSTRGNTSMPPLSATPLAWRYGRERPRAKEESRPAQCARVAPALTISTYDPLSCAESAATFESTSSFCLFMRSSMAAIAWFCFASISRTV